MNESANPIIKYFSEFKILKTVSKDFWLTNVVQFFDGMAYFSLITVFVLYLTDYCSFNDADAALWVGLYTLFISAFVFAVGSICDIIGIRRTYLIGFIILIAGRLIMGFGPDLSPTVDSGRLVVMTGILIMSFGTAFMSPVIQTSIRRFAPLNARATGFNIYYLLMNIAAVIANVFLIEFFRKHFGAVDGGYWIINFGTLMVLLGCITTRFIDEDNYAEPSEKEANLKAPLRRPLQLFREVWKESAFRKLILFLVLTMGVRIVFTLQFLVMPKYYVRTLYDDFAIGSINAINPAIIVSGLILLIPVLGRFSTVSLMIVGMSISAFSLVFMAIPIEWYYLVPGIETRSQAYLVAIVTQILVFAFGELLFSPPLLGICGPRGAQGQGGLLHVPGGIAHVHCQAHQRHHRRPAGRLPLLRRHLRQDGYRAHRLLGFTRIHVDHLPGHGRHQPHRHHHDPQDHHLRPSGGRCGLPAHCGH